MQTRGGPGKFQPQDSDVVSGRAVNRCQMMVGVLTRCESNARPSYARGRKAKKCGRDRPTRRRQRRDACGSAARGGGDERLYVRAVTATSGDAGARRET